MIETEPGVFDESHEEVLVEVKPQPEWTFRNKYRQERARRTMGRIGRSSHDSAMNELIMHRQMLQRNPRAKVPARSRARY